MRHRFVPDLGGLEYRFLLVKAYPTGSGSTSPPTSGYVGDPTTSTTPDPGTDPSATSTSNATNPTQTPTQ